MSASTFGSDATSEVLASWQRLQQSFAAVGPETDGLFAVGTDLLSHGKRLRAAFASAGWRSCGGAAGAVVEQRLAAALELFQMAALVHDDLMDGSLTRRGRPAAHRQFASLHDSASLIGGGERFGEAGAILLGDLLLVAAQSEFSVALTDLDADRRSSVHALVQEMMAEVTVGQYLDIYAQSAPWSSDPAVDLDRARRVICSKSARYSVEHPMVIGAAAAGADQPLLDRLRAVGLPIGEAFQLRDDVLGVFGDPLTTGKPAGDDLREGKRTVLLAVAMTKANETERNWLQGMVGNSALTESQVLSVRQLLTDLGAVDAVEDLITERYQTGLTALAATGLAPQHQESMAALAAKAIERDA